MIREYDDGDLLELLRLHERQGFQYEFPDLRGFVSRQVVMDGSEIQMAALVRPTTEAYLLVNREVSESPRARWEKLLALHEAVRAELRAKGVTDVHAWLPPELEKSFGRRLLRQGWTKPLWPCFTTQV